MQHHVALCILAVALLGCSDDQEPSPAPPSSEFPAKTWSWVDVPGTSCGTGTETGLGLNVNSSSTKLVIWLQGGGACYDETGCLGSDPSTSSFDGYGPEDFKGFAEGRGSEGHFDREDGKNPFADYNMAFIPYCTGDAHAGNSIVKGKTQDMHHKGQVNIKLDLSKLAELFPQVTEVVFSGSSAGGIGVMYNVGLVAEAFPSIKRSWVNDAGPLLPAADVPALAIVTPVWGLKNTVYAGCPANCLDPSDPDGGLHHLLAAYAKDFPDDRGSLLMAYRDKTIVSNFLVEADTLESSLKTFAVETAPKHPNFRYYYLEGDHHVWLDGDTDTRKLSDTVSGGVSLDTFLQQQLDGDDAWKSVEP